MTKDKDLFNCGSSEWDESEHPRDSEGKFTKANTSTYNTELCKVEDFMRQNLPANNKRIKVAEITSPIYDDMVLSNGMCVKDIVNRYVEMPLSGKVGAEHIESYQERKGFVSKYIEAMPDIINDPDLVFEDKTHENTLIIEKRVDKDIFVVASLNFGKTQYTNTLITMWCGNVKKEERKYQKLGKILYKKNN